MPETTIAWLFVSYTGLLCQIRDGKIGLRELSCGLFYFGCVRQEVYHPVDGVGVIERIIKDEAQRELILDLVREALCEGEIEGRVAWRERGDSNTYDRLNVLLGEHGLWTIDTPDHYNYPTVQTLMAAVNPQVSVVWHG